MDSLIYTQTTPVPSNHKGAEYVARCLCCSTKAGRLDWCKTPVVPFCRIQDKVQKSTSSDRWSGHRHRTIDYWVCSTIWGASPGQTTSWAISIWDAVSMLFHWALAFLRNRETKSCVLISLYLQAEQLLCHSPGQKAALTTGRIQPHLLQHTGGNRCLPSWPWDSVAHWSLQKHSERWRAWNVLVRKEW